MSLESGKKAASGSSQVLFADAADRGGMIIGIDEAEVGKVWFKFGADAVVGEGFSLKPDQQLVIDGEQKKVIRLSLNFIAASGTPLVHFQGI